MDTQTGMLAQLFERSMGLGPEWEVSDVWFEERGDAPDELHVRVAHVKGQAVECPECGRRCGTYDARERTWRHLDIWQYETIVHCAVPRADCPEHGVRTVRMPLGGAAELPLHCPVRGAGARHGPVGHDRGGDRSRILAVTRDMAEANAESQ